MKSRTDSLPSLPLLRYSMALGLAPIVSERMLMDLFEVVSSYFMLPAFCLKGTRA